MKAIVTGHNRGLGAALVDHLLARGVAVLGISRRRRADIDGAMRPGLQEVVLDLADTGALLAWLAGPALPEFLGDDGPALLINNAGLLQPIGPAGSVDNAALALALSANTVAPLLLANAFIGATTGGRERRILHVSSGAARQPYPGWSAYCAAKAALDHHARAVAQDALPMLRIASVAPGVVDTGMQAEIRACSSTQFPLRDRFVAMQDAGQLSPPETAAGQLVDYLLGDAFGAEPVTDIRNLPA